MSPVLLPRSCARGCSGDLAENAGRAAEEATRIFTDSPRWGRAVSDRVGQPGQRRLSPPLAPAGPWAPAARRLPSGSSVFLQQADGWLLPPADSGFFSAPAVPGTLGVPSAKCTGKGFAGGLGAVPITHRPFALCRCPSLPPVPSLSSSACPEPLPSWLPPCPPAAFSVTSRPLGEAFSSCVCSSPGSDITVALFPAGFAHYCWCSPERQIVSQRQKGKEKSP